MFLIVELNSLSEFASNSLVFINSFLFYFSFVLFDKKQVKVSHIPVTLARGSYPVGNYMFKVNDRNTRTRCEICSKLTIKIPERRHWCRSGIFIVNFEHISHPVLLFLSLTLSR